MRAIGLQSFVALHTYLLLYCLTKTEFHFEYTVPWCFINGVQALELVWHSFVKSFTNSFSRSYAKHSFLQQLHERSWRWSTLQNTLRRWSLESWLRRASPPDPREQAFVCPRTRIIYSQIATALSLPCVPSVKPLSLLFFLAKQATTEDESPLAVDGIHAQRGNREAEWCDENNRIVCEIIYLFYFTWTQIVKWVQRYNSDE